MLLPAMLLASLAAGCSLLPGSGLRDAIPPPATTSTLKDIPRVANSPRSPCWQQVMIAKQNSWLASRETGKVVIYEAPCRVDPAPLPPAAPQPASQPRTS